MPTTQLQLRRGTSAQTAVFTGATGEVTVDTDKKTLIVHDGTTVGGTELALKSRADASYAQSNTATTNAATADQRAVTSGSYANSAYGQANTGTQYATSAGVYANSAYSQANTATTNVATADQRAVTSGDYANSAYAKANTVASDLTSANTWLQSYVNTQVSNLVDSAPTTLDTLNELAAALGDDANFATTVTNTIATAGGYANSAFDAANTKLSTTGGTLTGNVISNSNITLETSNTALYLTANNLSTSNLNLQKSIGDVKQFVELTPTGILFSNTANTWSAYQGDSYSVSSRYEYRSRNHTGLSGTVNFYGGVDFDTTSRAWANTSDATPVYTTSSGGDAFNPGLTGLANGEIAIITTTILAQSHGAAGSNSFDGTKIWKSQKVATKTPTTLSIETVSEQISNTGNSGSWTANVSFEPGVSGTYVCPLVTGEVGKQIYWIVKIEKESLWCTFAPAAGGGGGGK